MEITQGLGTSIAELRIVINEYKHQLRRINVRDPENYPIVINIINSSGEEDEWRIDTGKRGKKESKEI